MQNNIYPSDKYLDDEAVASFTPKQKAVWDEMWACHDEIFHIVDEGHRIEVNGVWTFEPSITVAAYFLTKLSQYNDPYSVSFNDICSDGIDEDIYTLAVDAKISEVWNDLLKLLKKYHDNIFSLNAMLRRVDIEVATPDGVAELGKMILDVHAGDRVAELCCGNGLVISDIKSSFPHIDATGYDINPYAIAEAKIYSELSGSHIQFIKHDIFTLADNVQYTKVFANYPFGMRLRNLGEGKTYIEKLSMRIPSMSKATSSDWLYNMLLTDILEEDGKAVGVMTNGSTWNMIDAPIRKYFVENGLIECVIALPGKLFGFSPIATSMIVFSHGNKGVRLVDASTVFTAGRRTNELSDDDVTAILELIKNDSEKSFFVDEKALKENDYVLNTSRYLVRPEYVKDGTAFGNVIKRITRGAPLNAKQLDAISSSDPTGMQYLMLSNIKNGLIDTNLPYITEIDKKNEKYCLTNHCLILSKNGYPYKVAVAEIKEGQRILANGNLYIIEVDEEQIDPYYLAAFFSGESGTAALKSITVGATIPNIGVEQMKKLVIPIPEMEVQKEIASRYQQAKDEIMMLQLKIEKARDRMKHVCEEVL